ncbi:MAG: FAD-binding monooxygenase, partial [Gammaproteobacteria bacterium]
DALLDPGWRLVMAGGVPLPEGGFDGLRILRLGEQPETEGVVRDWFARHAAVAALVRPDHYVFGTAARAEDIGALLDEAATRLGLATACAA